MKLNRIIVLATLMCALSAQAASYPDALGDVYKPWSVMGYFGRMTKNTVGELVQFNAQFGDEKIYALELGYELSPDNMLRRFFQPVFSTVGFAFNAAYRNDPTGPIYEGIPMFVVRFTRFPWNKYVATTIGFAEGVSYVTHIPARELNDEDDSRRVLNYLMLEFTFASPQYRDLQFVLRVHHRSGMFGLYGAGNSGSTALGAGVRYRF